MTSDELFNAFVRGLLTTDAREAERRFRSWAAEVDIHDVDPRVVRLMPAFVQAIKRHQLPIPFEGHVKKFERYWWLNQRWLERSVQPVIESLLDASIPVVALKGLAVRNDLACPETRTMSDIDLWIPKGKVPDAVAILEAGGFTVSDDLSLSWRAHPARFQCNHHALPMRHKGLNMEVDLHWRLGGLISPRRSRAWLAGAAAKGPQVKGWPEGLRAMSGLPLVRTVMANGYMDAWSSGIWMLDVQALTVGWTEKTWLELRMDFLEDRREFMWNWCMWTLMEHDYEIPQAIQGLLPAGPALRFRRMVYRGHWNDEARGVFAWPWVRPWRSAYRLTWLHHQGEGWRRKLEVFCSFLAAERSRD